MDRGYKSSPLQLNRFLHYTEYRLMLLLLNRYQPGTLWGPWIQQDSTFQRGMLKDTQLLMIIELLQSHMSLLYI